MGTAISNWSIVTRLIAHSSSKRPGREMRADLTLIPHGLASVKPRAAAGLTGLGGLPTLASGYHPGTCEEGSHDRRHEARRSRLRRPRLRDIPNGDGSLVQGEPDQDQQAPGAARGKWVARLRHQRLWRRLHAAEVVPLPRGGHLQPDLDLLDRPDIALSRGVADEARRLAAGPP